MNNEKINLDYQFIPFPNNIFDLIIVNGLNKRELAFVLLVARLTYGCKNAQWAKIKFCDLIIVNISQSHAKEVVESVLAKKIVTQNEKTKKYRINEDYIRSEVPKMVNPQCEKLVKLVGRQLNLSSSQNGNENVTKLVTNALPKEEETTSQKSKINPFPKQEVPRLNDASFTHVKDSLKDIL